MIHWGLCGRTCLIFRKPRSESLWTHLRCIGVGTQASSKIRANDFETKYSESKRNCMCLDVHLLLARYTWQFIPGFFFFFAHSFLDRKLIEMESQNYVFLKGLNLVLTKLKTTWCLVKKFNTKKTLWELASVCLKWFNIM